jgi:glycyl-tRNA synthetase beta chain
MVREFPELQGIMGGVYARAEGKPEEVWKAIYYHYLPHAVEKDAAPTPKQLGKSEETWAAVSLADKLDTLVGLFAAGEKPTGSRDPFGLRRAAQGVMKILIDQPFTADRAPDIEQCVEQAFANYGDSLKATEGWRQVLFEFLAEREAHIFERRGFRTDETRAVARFWKRPPSALKRIEALAKERGSADFTAVAALLSASRTSRKTSGMEPGIWRI